MNSPGCRAGTLRLESGGADNGVGASSGAAHSWNQACLDLIACLGSRDMVALAGLGNTEKYCFSETEKALTFPNAFNIFTRNLAFARGRSFFSQL